METLTKVHQDVVQDGNGKRNETLVLEMASYGIEPIALNKASPVFIRVGTRVARETERVNLEPLA